MIPNAETLSAILKDYNMIQNTTLFLFRLLITKTSYKKILEQPEKKMELADELFQ